MLGLRGFMSVAKELSKCVEDVWYRTHVHGLSHIYFMDKKIGDTKRVAKKFV